MQAPDFRGHQVIGWGRLDYLLWADESSRPDIKLECRLSLPAMQRNSLWRPRVCQAVIEA